MGTNVLVHSILQGPKPLDEQTPGTATASEILNGETAWVNGTKVTGTMKDRNTIGVNAEVALTSDNTTDPVSPTTAGLGIYANGDGNSRLCVKANPGYYDGSSYVGFLTSYLGTATAADVASGKTFTSTAGLKVTGTGTMCGQETLVQGQVYKLYTTETGTTSNTGTGYPIGTTYYLSLCEYVEGDVIDASTLDIERLIHISYNEEQPPVVYESSEFTVCSNGRIKIASKEVRIIRNASTLCDRIILVCK